MAILPLSGTGLVPAAEAGGRVLVFAKVSDDPKKHYGGMKYLAEYVAAGMKDLGVIGARVRLVRDNEEMVRLLRSGEVDWATETVYSSALFETEAGARIVLRRWKGGMAEYHTVFFSRADGDVSSLEALRGRKLAFEDRGSTSGYRLPIKEMHRRGLETVPLVGRDAEVPANTAGYLFAGNEINIATWVHQGVVDAGAFSNLDWDDPRHMPRPFRNHLRVFHRSKPYPRAVELVRGDLEPAIRDRLIAILLSAHEDHEGRKVLYAYGNTARFDTLDANARAAIDELHKKNTRP